MAARVGRQERRDRSPAHVAENAELGRCLADSRPDRIEKPAQPIDVRADTRCRRTDQAGAGADLGLELPDGVRCHEQSVGGKSPRHGVAVFLLDQDDPLVALERRVFGGLVDRIESRQSGGGEALVALVRELMGVEKGPRRKGEVRPASRSAGHIPAVRPKEDSSRTPPADSKSFALANRDR
jgi:hypothetical protein